MAFSLSSSMPNVQYKTTSSIHQVLLSKSFDTPRVRVVQRGSVVTKCELKDSNKVSKLEIGSPIIVTEAPKMLKTAASVPCLRVNADLVKPGDVGRIVSRKPKDVWAVRLSIGTYLIDGKYFKPLELNQ